MSTYNKDHPPAIAAMKAGKRPSEKPMATNVAEATR